MKLMLNFTFSIIIASALNKWFLDLVKATESYESNIKIHQNGVSLKEVSQVKEPITTTADIADSNTISLKETEQHEFVLPSHSVIDDSSYLYNSDASSELSITAEAIVFPSVGTAAELKDKIRTQFQQEKANSSNPILSSLENEKKEYIVRAEPKMQEQTIAEGISTNEALSESELTSRSSQQEPKKTAPQHEDIPSFSEWTQKQLAEAEKKKTDQNETTDRFNKPRAKFRNKNYASPDCGAKIVAANPESLSSSSVLSPLKDEYMLNYCTNRIWFVVELCEAIQAKQLDLANFELFSSSPKHFSVYVSHRFPTREWSNVGKFTALDSRDVQTFNLHPHLFGKFVKVELHSHYGREQFCPISWVGIYGTSEFEVLAKEEERHLHLEEEDVDSYDEEIFVGQKRDSPKNLFSSATDAVLSIVKKATAPFMKTDSNETESQSVRKVSSLNNAPCVCPRFIVVCNNCSQNFYDEVFDMLSCRHINLQHLLFNSFVNRILINSESCAKFGLNFISLRTGAPFPSNFPRNPKQEVNYLTIMLKKSFVASLCNALAVVENKVVVNATIDAIRSLSNVTKKKDPCKEVNPSKSEALAIVKPSRTCRINCPQSTSSQFHYRSFLFSKIFKTTEQFSQKIEPTKTLTEDEVKMLPPSNNVYTENTSKIPAEKFTELPGSNKFVTPTATLTIKKEKNENESSLKKENKVSVAESNVESERDMETENQHSHESNQYSTLESIISDINAIEKAVDYSNSPLPPAPNLPTESIFLRLANRIKNLEINMSLSSTYLEELSKRYRTQLELLSKTLNLTVQKVEEFSKLEEEKERRREKEMLLIRMQLANLTRDLSLLLRDKNSWNPQASSISKHILFISIEILLVWALFSYWKRHKNGKNNLDKSEPFKKISRKYKRRNSLEGVKGHETPRRRLRRPSDEALEIALCTKYNPEPLKMEKKRKRKKKDSKCSLNGVHLKRKKSEPALPSTLSDQSNSTLILDISRPEFISSDVINRDEVEVSNRFSVIACSDSPLVNDKYAGNNTLQSFSSPAFIKTAVSARNSRVNMSEARECKEFSVSSMSDQEPTREILKEKKSSNSFKKYMKKFF